MKFYDFEKLKVLVEENPGKVISLGMVEDWFWTGVEVYDGEKFTVSPLSDGRTV